MEAAVLSNETALLLLTLEAKLATTQNNLNDFFITISAILVFGNYFSIELCTLRLFISCINSHASRVFTDGNWIGSFQECHQHLDEKHVGCMWVCFIHDIPVSCFKIFIFYYFVSIVIGATVYWLVGYAFAFGDGNEFIGWTGFALQGVSPSKLSFWFYQTIFANTASTIVRYCGISFMRDFLKRLTRPFFFQNICLFMQRCNSWKNQLACILHLCLSTDRILLSGCQSLGLASIRMAQNPRFYRFRRQWLCSHAWRCLCTGKNNLIVFKLICQAFKKNVLNLFLGCMRYGGPANRSLRE